MRRTSIREVVEDIFSPYGDDFKSKDALWWQKNFKCHPDDFTKEIKLDRISLIANYFGYGIADIAISKITTTLNNRSYYKTIKDLFNYEWGFFL
ncbi:MAG: hypothetical protein COB81_05130 [Flavobacteriaceae bacterium]|nr:MAG: hypothetical protein COB81_05130 [Flavobacteriaceae bacterium]